MPYKKIDFHTHIGKNYSQINKYELKEEDLLRKMDENNVLEAVIFSEVSPEPWMIKFNDCFGYPLRKNNKQVNRNVFEISKKDSRLLPFYFADIRDTNAGRELNELVNEGLDFRGIKVHQTVSSVDIKMLETSGILKSAEKNEIPILIHLNSENTHGNENLGIIADKYNNIDFVIAHFGFVQNNLLNLVSMNENIFLDTAGITHKNFLKAVLNYNRIGNATDYMVSTFLSQKITEEFAVESENVIFKQVLSSVLDSKKLIEVLTDTCGSNHLIFGSDEPWSSMSLIIPIIENADIKESDKENIFYNNAKKILKK